jgi:hypothetical protein|nr:hypothetical protein [uncultured Steroidobacter sp.]
MREGGGYLFTAHLVTLRDHAAQTCFTARPHRGVDKADRERAVADIDDMIPLLDDALLASRAGAGELVEDWSSSGKWCGRSR